MIKHTGLFALISAALLAGCGGGEEASVSTMTSSATRAMAVVAQINGTSIFSGVRANYTITKTSTGYTVVDTTGIDGTTTIAGFAATLQFADKSLTFDPNGNAAKAYRLYRAAFNRTSDPAGIGYWIAQLDSGITPHSVANAYITSPEFTSLYGSSISNSRFVDIMYANVLHRVPDAAGYNYWLAALASGYSRAQVLVDFSESPENVAQTAPEIAAGIEFNLPMPVGFLSDGVRIWSVPTAQKYWWGAGKAYCDGVINGQSGWRLPTYAEAQALAASGKWVSVGSWAPPGFLWSKDLVRPDFVNEHVKFYFSKRTTGETVVAQFNTGADINYQRVSCVKDL